MPGLTHEPGPRIAPLGGRGERRAVGAGAWRRKVRTYYIGPERPLNADVFTDLVLAKAGEALPDLFEIRS